MLRGNLAGSSLAIRLVVLEVEAHQHDGLALCEAGHGPHAPGDAQGI